MTARELLEKLKQLPESDLDLDVVTFDSEENLCEALNIEVDWEDYLEITSFESPSPESVHHYPKFTATTKKAVFIG